MFDASRNDLCLGIVGAGLMGRGMAQIAAQAGIQVVLFDNSPETAETARLTIAEVLGKLSAKGKIDYLEASAAAARITVADSLTKFERCHVVIEAIIENLDAKRELFRRLEEVVSDTCLLATNTSSLSVTEIAATCKLPGRLGGFHFFNPVPVMKVVEVIDGVRSESWVGSALGELAVRFGHTPVRAKDSPGFIVNHAGRGFLTEALRIVGEGIADFSQVDGILRGAGFKLGPFELLDLTGLDVSYPVMEAIYNQYYQEPRYRPSLIARQRLVAGLLGRKTGQGFYKYADGKKLIESPEEVPDAAVVMKPIWVGSSNSPFREEVIRLIEAKGALVDKGERPTAESICIVLPIGLDVTTAALSEKLDPAKTIGIDPLHLDGQVTLMKTPVTAADVSLAVRSIFASNGTSPICIHDSPGFVAQRVKAMIVNIGCDMAQQRIATPSDIDRAVTLGLGYPMGPLTMGDSMGAKVVLQILEELNDFYRDPRYRPSPWLIRRARLGVSLLTPEN
ncbi:3-hydroxyacyl-CoA dehydrogenase [Ferribacterium limneticum]|nr:3-hydroxyacyl-CoA dehydrogenase [Ferribacterium limneticum]